MNYKDHSQSIAHEKNMHLFLQMHEKLSDHRIVIMKEVNSSLDATYKLFIVLETFKEFVPKSFVMKVKCVYYSTWG